MIFFGYAFFKTNLGVRVVMQVGLRWIAFGGCVADNIWFNHIVQIGSELHVEEANISAVVCA